MSLLPPDRLWLSLYKLAFMASLAIGLFSYLRWLWKSLKKDWQHLQRLHQIPCHRCAFFTGEYNLKCTVHPYKALNEDAIGCGDYQRAKLYRSGSGN
jgi:hypothetical protein